MPTRLATADDRDLIVSLLSELRETAVYASDIEESLGQIIAAANSAVILSHELETNTANGMVVINIINKLPKREARLDEVVVASAARGRGIGQELILAAEAWARMHDADKIELTSRPSRLAANHIYQKLHYQTRDTNVYFKEKGDF